MFFYLTFSMLLIPIVIRLQEGLRLQGVRCGQTNDLAATHMKSLAATYMKGLTATHMRGLAVTYMKGLTDCTFRTYVTALILNN